MSTPNSISSSAQLDSMLGFRPSWTVQGRNGHQLNLAWSDSPEAYFGIAAANTPNYFIFNGPNSPGKRPLTSKAKITHGQQWVTALF
jgi:cation diffusion facilitator CzcD-associated flavoprotein CzcO